MAYMFIHICLEWFFFHPTFIVLNSCAHQRILSDEQVIHPMIISQKRGTKFNSQTLFIDQGSGHVRACLYPCKGIGRIEFYPHKKKTGLELVPKRTEVMR